MICNRIIVEIFYADNFGFVNYGTEYYISFFCFTLLGIVIIWYGKKCRTQGISDNIHLPFIVIYLLLQISKIFIRLYLNTFDVREDLPLYLCNLMPFFMLWSFAQKNEKVFKIFAFWILAGSFQSLITPTLEHSFPHYEYFRYWFVHSGITISVLYGFFVYKWKLTLRDGMISLIWLNIFAAFIYIVNTYLGSNYFYLNAKPPGTNLYTLLSDWPWYILQLEFVAVFLFSVVASPFYLMQSGMKFTTPAVAIISWVKNIKKIPPKTTVNQDNFNL